MRKSILLAAAALASLATLSCVHVPGTPTSADASCPACDAAACDAASAPATAPANPTTAHVEVPTTGVRTIALPTIDTDLPPGPGRLTLVSACTLCHTPRYVTMQPNFSKKKWTEEVDKMRKVYGAPVQDEQVEPIVKYLVAIRGNGQ